MADVVSKETRSRMMAAIRGTNTAPELALRKEMHGRGFRFRLHVPGMPGRPDLVFPKHRAVVLVHGCFWHRHVACRLATTPTTNVPFWSAKFEGNVARDACNLKKLHDTGWRTAVIWECEVRGGATRAAEQLEKWLRSQKAHIEIPFRSKRLL